MLMIHLNGQVTHVPSGSLVDLLHHLGLQDKRLAVAVNHHVIPHTQHAHYVLHDADHVEIVTAVGGG